MLTDSIIELVGILYGKEIDTYYELYRAGFTHEEIRMEIANMRELEKRQKKTEALSKVRKRQTL